MTVYTIKAVSCDSFGVVPGAGYVVLENGKRIDWPMLRTRAEAEKDVREFAAEMRQLARDEYSESRFLMAFDGRPYDSNPMPEGC